MLILINKIDKVRVKYILIKIFLWVIKLNKFEKCLFEKLNKLMNFNLILKVLNTYKQEEFQKIIGFSYLKKKNLIIF